MALLNFLLILMVLFIFVLLGFVLKIFDIYWREINMKTIFVIAILTFASSFELGIGNMCGSLNIFQISSFSVTPFPPTGCGPQTITMNGTFNADASPNHISIFETYNLRDVYGQNIDVASGPFTSNQTQAFNFNFNPFWCSP